MVPNWWYRNGTGGGPEHDIAFRVVPKWSGTERKRSVHVYSPSVAAARRCYSAAAAADVAMYGNFSRLKVNYY